MTSVPSMRVPDPSETDAPTPTYQPQWIITDHDGNEFLLSFWGGIVDADPEVAPRVDGTRWGVPFQVRRIA